MEVRSADPDGFAGADDLIDTCSKARAGARIGKGTADHSRHALYARHSGDYENDEQQNIIDEDAPWSMILRVDTEVP